MHTKLYTLMSEMYCMWIKIQYIWFKKKVSAENYTHHGEVGGKPQICPTSKKTHTYSANSLGEQSSIYTNNCGNPSLKS